MLQFSQLKVLSYNIHKGFTLGNLKYVLNEIKLKIIETGADVVFLQEVGERKDLGSQFEYLADDMWPHYAYGKNSVYENGHHGNAILSRYPIISHENIDLTQYKLEKRGLLCATICDSQGVKVHLMTLHLDLMHRNRNKQLQTVTEYINRVVPENDIIILGGDFNDWSQKASQILKNQNRLLEVHSHLHMKYARTFPSVFPILPLDRIYFRNLEPLRAEVLESGSWKSLSDHLALFTEFKLI